VSGKAYSNWQTRVRKDMNSFEIPQGLNIELSWAGLVGRRRKCAALAGEESFNMVLGSFI